MKKQIISGIAIALCLGSLTSCDRSADDNAFGRGVLNAFDKSEITYKADTRFLYSLDGGTSWSETLQEVPVDSTYYLAIEMQVTQSEETKEEKTVVSTITIPYTDVLDCYLDDHPGTSITGKEDSVNNSISYDFNIVAGTSPSKFRVVFECKPLSDGRATVEVVYDDNVSESWDKTGSIKYVKPEPVETTTTTTVTTTTTSAITTTTTSSTTALPEETTDISTESTSEAIIDTTTTTTTAEDNTDE